MLGCFLVALVNGMEGLGTQELTNQATNMLLHSYFPSSSSGDAPREEKDTLPCSLFGCCVYQHLDRDNEHPVYLPVMRYFLVRERWIQLKNIEHHACHPALNKH